MYSFAFTENDVVNDVILEKKCKLNLYDIPAEQERAESTRIEMIDDSDQEMFVEFESIGELSRYLPNTIDKL